MNEHVQILDLGLDTDVTNRLLERAKQKKNGRWKWCVVILKTDDYDPELARERIRDLEFSFNQSALETEVPAQDTGLFENSDRNCHLAFFRSLEETNSISEYDEMEEED